MVDKLNDDRCIICGKKLSIWYCCAGGGKYKGCSDILCNYKKEIDYD